MEDYSPLLKSEEDVGSSSFDDNGTPFKKIHALKRRWHMLALLELLGSSILNICFAILMFFSYHRRGPQPSSFGKQVTFRYMIDKADMKSKSRTRAFTPMGSYSRILRK